MPWKECHVMDERLRFVARLLEGEKMAPLCAEFGISRKAGYKIFDRYKDCGVTAFTDRSRRAHRQANRLPAPVEAVIVRPTRSWTVMAWCGDGAAGGPARRAPRCHGQSSRTRSGARTTKASSCSAIIGTATR